MTPSFVVQLIVVCAASACLLFAAFTDIASRKISNRIVLGVIALFALSCLGGDAEQLQGGLAAGAVALVIGFGLYIFNVVGAGDVKLFTAVAMLVTIKFLPLLFIATVLSGGFVALALMILKHQHIGALSGPGTPMAALKARVPYGVAIALGGAFVLWGQLTGTISPDMWA